MNIVGSKIKTELEDPGGEVDVARGRFESALLELLNREDNSESDNDSDSDQKELGLQPPGYRQDITDDVLGNSRGNSILRSRPLRKRRRKEAETHDGGFHHTFVMRMFDRSVDLAQFEESSPLYPICRAWMLNQPHNSDLCVKQESDSPFHDAFEDGQKEKDSSEDEIPQVTVLPDPEPWPESEDALPHDPRVPKPAPFKGRKLNNGNEDVAPALLLTQHLRHWRYIRNKWKLFGQRADARYNKSYIILKAMFDKECEEKNENWNNAEDKKDITESENIDT